MLNNNIVEHYGFSCKNGKPKKGVGFKENCIKCNDGFKLNNKNSCVSINITCPNGKPTTNKTGNKDKVECASCNIGYDLKDGKCIKKDCEKIFKKIMTNPDSSFKKCIDKHEPNLISGLSDPKKKSLGCQAMKDLRDCIYADPNLQSCCFHINNNDDESHVKQYWNYGKQYWKRLCGNENYPSCKKP